MLLRLSNWDKSWNWDTCLLQYSKHKPQYLITHDMHHCFSCVDLLYACLVSWEILESSQAAFKQWNEGVSGCLCCAEIQNWYYFQQQSLRCLFDIHPTMHYTKLLLSNGVLLTTTDDSGHLLRKLESGRHTSTKRHPPAPSWLA